MAGDHTEKLDEYCQEQYGHTNWGYLDTYTKEELAKAFKNTFFPMGETYGSTK